MSAHLLALLAISPDSQSALHPAGPQASRIYSLTQLFVSTNGVIFGVVIVACLLALMRSARNRDEKPGEIANRRQAATWISVCVGLTVAVLTVYLFQSVARGRAMSTFPGRDALEIDVIGHQWWWEFHYANPSAGMRFITANEIHIPVGRPVRIVTDSRDVIHSFWIPNLHGKLDLIPNHQNQTWLQASTPGEFRGQCAEYCGLQHAHMSFIVVAEPEADFRRWVDLQRSPAADPRSSQQQGGQGIFLASSCVVCHTVRGTQAMASAGPDLTHLATRRYIAAGTAPNSRSYLAGWIIDGQHMKPGNRMPPINLEPRDMDQLLDYLESLR